MASKLMGERLTPNKERAESLGRLSRALGVSVAASGVRRTFPILALPIVVGATSDVSLADFLVGTWKIETERSLDDLAARLSIDVTPERRDSLGRGWNQTAARLEFSTTEVTFHGRLSEPRAYRYEVAEVQGDALNLRVYRPQGGEFRISLQRRDEHIVLGSGACNFLREECEVFFYYSRDYNP